MRTWSGDTRAPGSTGRSVWTRTRRSSTSHRVGGRWPLPPGEYVAAYLLDDGPVAVARIPFRIVP